ncbi:hypothetical protein FUA23_14795 [Neolewinella aurantiaca]|uniref:Uncharacterized protein n=1 Tax=Neolewinella aurantiaca TaxID=2602767 RepID=A0A5C7FBX4_9BACT|nr:hypothetical protein [Neolewinella aurantiaca]TXF88403.1 hypothetical protein FUA23_14795 [Neolewinella aurantiaca]
MSFFTRTILFSLLCISSFSCIEESEDFIIRTPGDAGQITEPDEPSASTNFKFGYIEVDLFYAYVRTTAMPDGQTFQHHLVLTESDVLDNDNLRNEVPEPTAAILLQSDNPVPVGEFRVSDGSLLDAGTETSYIVSAGSYLLRDLRFDSGSTVTISAQDGEYLVEVDILHNANPRHTFRGTFTGPLVPVNPVSPEAEEVSPEDFSGENYMLRDEESFALTNAYLVPYSNYYRLYLTEEPVHNAEDLLGESDVMLLALANSSGGDLESGRHKISNTFETFNGYFREINTGQVTGSYFCRQMDFRTGTALDDEPMDTGETLVYIEGDEFSIRFDFESFRGANLRGEYHGEVMKLGF